MGFPQSIEAILGYGSNHDDDSNLKNYHPQIFSTGSQFINRNISMSKDITNLVEDIRMLSSLLWILK